MGKGARYGALVLAGAILAGCGPSETPTASTRSEVLPPLYSKQVKPLDNLDRSKLFISHITSSNRLYVSDDVGQALDVFVAPPKAYAVDEAPPGWDDEGFRTVGWESPDEGFGVILQKDRIAVAAFSEKHADLELFDRTVSDYADVLGKPQLSLGGQTAKYAFWTDDDQTLMICGTSVPTGNAVTVAVGARELMDALRMNPDRAQEDIVASDAIVAAHGKEAASQ